MGELGEGESELGVDFTFLLLPRELSCRDEKVHLMNVIPFLLTRQLDGLILKHQNVTDGVTFQ